MKENAKATPATLCLTEVAELLAVVSGRYAARDRCLVLLMFKHGLHVGEVSALQVSDIDLAGERLLIRRARVDKAHPTCSHRLHAEEAAALQQWLAIRERLRLPTDDLFVSAQRKRLSRKTIWLLLRQYGARAGLTVSVYPEILRDSCRAVMLAQGIPEHKVQAFLTGRADSTDLMVNLSDCHIKDARPAKGERGEVRPDELLYPSS